MFKGQINQENKNVSVRYHDNEMAVILGESPKKFYYNLLERKKV